MNSNIIELNQKEISTISGGQQDKCETGFQCCKNWIYDKASSATNSVIDSAGNIAYTAVVAAVSIFGYIGIMKIRGRMKGKILSNPTDKPSQKFIELDKNDKQE